MGKGGDTAGKELASVLFPVDGHISRAEDFQVLLSRRTWMTTLLLRRCLPSHVLHVDIRSAHRPGHLWENR
jgi:hypothetical protein